MADDLDPVAFVETIRAEVRSSRRKWKAITKACGVPQHWLHAFSYNQITSPPFVRLAAVARVLGHPLTAGKGEDIRQ